MSEETTMEAVMKKLRRLEILSYVTVVLLVIFILLLL